MNPTLSLIVTVADPVAVVFSSVTSVAKVF